MFPAYMPPLHCFTFHLIAQRPKGAGQRGIRCCPCSRLRKADLLVHGDMPNLGSKLREALETYKWSSIFGLITGYKVVPPPVNELVIIPMNYRYNPPINPSEIVLINQLSHLGGTAL